MDALIDRLPPRAAKPVRDKPAFPASQNSPQAAIKSVGVVGLGRMGAAFAANLLTDGYGIVAFDRDQQRAQPLQAMGARAAERLADLAACDLVISMLPDDAALETVALGPDGLIAILRPGAVHVSMSTISPELSRRLASAHAAHGQDFVAAPVLGNPDLAHTQRLFVLAGGAPQAVARARPVLEQLGQRVFVIGDDPGQASLVKLAGNVMTAATLQSMGEVLALLRKGGIDPHLAFDVFTSSLFDGRVHKTYGGKIVDERYDPPGMTAPLAMKDLRLALAEAERLAVPMAVTSVVHDRLVAAVARGFAGLDWSALGLLAAVDAGLAGTATAARQKL
ncbi:MAG TPA: NAD(P)-dependent oxidoreductase [Acetobacteraceae bacterium]|jgi:3-hydroxyisobutyrate dehydrogenase-like beta-hydroxyacid dehydrogenase|nr:NAD(P)-dependent oxidoreductase [Acetobacteraceae bacterium]